MKNRLRDIVRCAAVILMAGILALANVETAVSEETGTDTQTEEPAAAEELTEAEETEDAEESTETEEPELVSPKLKLSSKPGGKIKLSWKKVEGAEEYVLIRGAKADGDLKKIKTFGARTTSFVDEGLKVGEVYYYRLTAFAGERSRSAESVIVSGRSLGTVKLTGISNISGSQKLVLSWDEVPGADSYKVMRLNTGSGAYEKIASVKGTSTTYTDKNRTGGTVYTYKVCAVDKSGGRGAYSKPMSQMAIDANKKMIALTYDDGPSVNTPIVLDVLEKYDAHATFFVIGYSVDRYSDSLRREIALGCEIGNHTYNHDMLKTLSAKEIQATLERVNTAVKKQTGVDIRVMRPPGGGQNESVRAAVGMPLINWSVDTLDWKTRSTSATIQCVKKEACDGAIVLMHDLHKPTAEAAEEIVRYLKNEGYQMVTISEMAAYRGGMENGKVYTQFKK